MPRRFGTDGIRGVANVDLRAEDGLALGRAVAHALVPSRGRLLVGADTRRSGGMLIAALGAGATSRGVDVVHAGVLPTPALAWALPALGFDAGVMVSASHNPAPDNGLKVLDAAGLKLDEAREDALEALMDRAGDLPLPDNAGMGRFAHDDLPAARYRAARAVLAASTPGRFRVHLDCAHGAASRFAGEIVGAGGSDVSVHFAEPDGTNINDGCGATAPEALAAIVARDGGDAGFAFDGDADRCVAVDEQGRVVDGDRLIGLIALDRLERMVPGAGTVVVSILSNGGLADALARAGGRVVRTPVGDRWIMEEMRRTGAAVGGEKSGHVIIAEHARSGDGIVTALEVLAVMARTGRRLSELAERIPLFPQEQRAIHVGRKDAWQDDPQLVGAVTDAEAELAGRGRIVVRPSGTEPALRVMVEGPDAAQVRRIADDLAALVAERLA